MNRSLSLPLLIVALSLFSGCAAIALPLLGAGVGLLAEREVDHVLKGTASKTFAVPLEGVHTALLRSLDLMGLTIEATEQTESGYTMSGLARDRRVEIGLQQVSAQFTHMRVDVKRNFFWRDRATADAIIEQTDWSLSQIKLAGQVTPPARSRPRVSLADILRAPPLRSEPPGSRQAAGTGFNKSRSDIVRSGKSIASPAPRLASWPTTP